LIETIGAFLLISLCAGAGCRFLRAEWLETRCIHQTFEAAIEVALHQRLSGSAESRGVQVRLNSRGVSVRKICGNRLETVHINHLDSLDGGALRRSGHE
jgi:hypothetical protein